MIIVIKLIGQNKTQNLLNSFEMTCFQRLSSPVLSWFTSLSTCQPISLIEPTLIIHHTFTLSFQAQNLPFQ